MNLEIIMKLVNWASFVGTQAWLVQLLYFFLTQIFLQWEVLEKEYRMQNWEMDIVKLVDKMDTRDKEVKNLTRGRWIPIKSVKSENYFENYGYKTGGVGCIDSDKSNPVYLVGSYC